MKKFITKTLPIVCCLLICLCPLFLSGCDKNEFEDLNITFGKKYYYLEDIDSLSSCPYYIFYGNGTGLSGSSNTKSNFQYTVIDDNRIVCFSDDGGTWHKEFTVSKNVIKCTEINNNMTRYEEQYFVCETYIPKISNFKP